MKAIVVTDQTAGTAGMKLVERPEPQGAALASLSGANYGDVVVQVHASGFTGDELSWPSTWVDRLGRDRTPSIPGHELAGVVTALSYGTTGLSVGQRVFGLTDWTRDGTLAEYIAVEARNLAPLPGDVDFTVGAALVMSGLTAWQGLFEHGRLQCGAERPCARRGRRSRFDGTQLAREAGAYVIGTGRAAGRQTALDFGAQEFLDLDNDALEDVGGVDLVFDVLGGDIGKRSAGVIRAGGTLVNITGPTEARPADGRTVYFVVVPDRTQLNEIVRRARDGRVRTNIGKVAALDDAVAAFNPTEPDQGKDESSAFVREDWGEGERFCLDFRRHQAQTRGDAEWQDSSPHLLFTSIWGEARSKCAVCFLGIHTHSQALSGVIQLEADVAVTKPRARRMSIHPSWLGLPDADRNRLDDAPLSRAAGRRSARSTFANCRFREKIPHVSTRTL